MNTDEIMALVDECVISHGRDRNHEGATMNHSEAMTLALEALEASLSDDRPYIVQSRAAIQALRGALAGQQGEPVAYLYTDARTPREATLLLHSTMLVLAADRRPELRGETPLYTTPPQASQPNRFPFRECEDSQSEQPEQEPEYVQLRHKEEYGFSPWGSPLDPKHRHARWAAGVEMRLLYTAPPQASQPERYIVPEFIPIAQRKLADLMADGYQVTGYSIERTRDDSVRRGAVTCGGMVLWWHGDSQTVQASQPLTDAQIEQCMKQAHSTVQGRNLEHAFARAIEQAHGIGAQKGKP